MLNIILEQAKSQNKFPDFQLKQYSTETENIDSFLIKP